MKQSWMTSIVHSIKEFSNHKIRRFIESTIKEWSENPQRNVSYLGQIYIIWAMRYLLRTREFELRTCE